MCCMEMLVARSVTKLLSQKTFRREDPSHWMGNIKVCSTKFPTLFLWLPSRCKHETSSVLKLCSDALLLLSDKWKFLLIFLAWITTAIPETRDICGPEHYDGEENLWNLILHYKYEEEFLFFCHWEKLKKSGKRSGESKRRERFQVIVEHSIKLHKWMSQCKACHHLATHKRKNNAI